MWAPQTATRTWPDSAGTATTASAAGSDTPVAPVVVTAARCIFAASPSSGTS